MYCSQCGKEISEGSKFCQYCGKEQEVSHKVKVMKASEEGQSNKKLKAKIEEWPNEKIKTQEEQPGNQEKGQAEGQSITVENVQVEGISQDEKTTSNEGKKNGRWKWFVGALVIMLAIGVGAATYYLQTQKRDWKNWTSTYEKEMSDYYLSDEEENKLSDYLMQATKIEQGKKQELLKMEMQSFKEQVANENSKYISDIDEGMDNIKNNYDLKYAYDEETAQITKLQEEILKLKEDKKYPEALSKIEECKGIEEKIQQVQSGWNVSVVQTDISQYPKIKLYLDIRDQAGNAIENLEQKVFFLSQKEAASGEYVKQKITSAMQLNENESININLVADTSGSMSGNLEAVKGIMSNFLSTVQFGVGDKVALTQFSDTSYIMQNFTSDKMSMLAKINAMYPSGGTKLYDTLIESVLNVYGQTGAKCVIAFTDGLDNRSATTPEEVVRVARNCNIPIFIIGIGYDLDNSVLSQIATSTGGYYTNILDVNSNMQDIYNRIYTSQKQVYCLSYETDGKSMMDEQDLSVYLRGKDGGGTASYAFKPADDFFNILLNNYLNSYIRALTEGNPAVMSEAGYVSTSGDVFAQTKDYIEKNKLILAEQLLQAEVTNIKYIDENTYEITSQEVYDIQQVKDYAKEIAGDTSTEMQNVRQLLSGYSIEEVKSRPVAIHKERTLKGHYQIKKSAEGKWQIANFTANYENLGTNVYTAYLEE